MDNEKANEQDHNEEAATATAPPTNDATGDNQSNATGDEGNEAVEASTNTANDTDPEEGGIWEPAETDVLCGRGASVNSNPGNKRFRASCFAHKAQFEAANHAAKRFLVTNIVTKLMEEHGARFLRKKHDKGPWFEMTKEEAILKASQVIRDYKRPDRMAQRQLMNASGKKRNRAVSTPMDDVEVLPEPEKPIIDFPRGVNKNDVLSGRGAYVNGHVGNQNMRKLAIGCKAKFDSSNFAVKRQLATEIVDHLRELDPPGRFLKRLEPGKPVPKDAKVVAAPDGDQPGWEELDREKAIHKACQVMRDLDRADRRERDERRRLKKLKKEGKLPPGVEIPGDNKPVAASADIAENASSEVVEEAVAAAEYAMDKALEAANAAKEDETMNIGSV